MSAPSLPSFIKIYQAVLKKLKMLSNGWKTGGRRKTHGQNIYAAPLPVQ